MNAAELADLAPETTVTLPEPPPPGAQPGATLAPAALTEAQQWAAAPGAVGMIFSLYLPELEKVYTDEACLRWGEAMAKFAERRGWKASKFFEWLEPIIPLAMATKPLLVPTVAAFRAKLAEIRAAQAAADEPKTDSPPAP